MKKSKKLILWFNQVGIKDVPRVGGKNASLGEMYRKLTKKGISIPNGFATTSFAYWHFLEKAEIKEKIREILERLDVHNIKDLSKRAKMIRETIIRAEFPQDLKQEIIKAYRKLCQEYKVKNLDVAVRSSATAEDLPGASFAGLQETFLNIRGEEKVIEACKKCIASLFTERAISYREEKGFSRFKVALSCCVQKMVRSDLASAGVVFTLDTESGFRDVVLINASWGLGENVVKGVVNPDEYFVFKPTLKKKFRPIVGKACGTKKRKLIYCLKGKETTRNISVPKPEREKFVLSDDEILQLSKWACLIEDFYKISQDIEWAKDGKTGEIFIVQARPETVKAIKKGDILEKYVLQKKGKVLIEGTAVGDRIGQGKAKVILDVKDIHKFKPGEVLVTKITDPDWEPIMKIASAIITDKGGKTSHAAIVSRELGIPCIVGTSRATQIIKQGEKITVCCSEGELGKIYQGLIPYKIRKINLKKLEKPKTKIMMNIGVPRQAFALSFIPSDGVGLAREEFIIANFIKIHPKALIDYKKIKDKKIKEKIDRLTRGTKNKTQFFIDELAEGIGRIAAAFYPKEVIVRLSDFKSKEYAGLIGGKFYEPKESNPMLGLRGASRYYDKSYKDAFILECQALKKIREEMGFFNVKIMIPFCRTVEEGRKVLKIMASQGLIQGKNALEVYVMCEIPSNVILAEEFSKDFDGFSIGTNDLTQLTLGVDRDSELVAHIFDERNEAVKEMVRQVIKKAHKHKPYRKVGICGDAPSTFPDFAQFLVECGIDSISLSPDAVIKTILAILKAERKIAKRKTKKA